MRWDVIEVFDLHFPDGQWYWTPFQVPFGHLYVFLGEINVRFGDVCTLFSGLLFASQRVNSPIPPTSKALKRWEFCSRLATLPKAHRSPTQWAWSLGVLSTWGQSGPISNALLLATQDLGVFLPLNSIWILETQRSVKFEALLYNCG